MQIKEAFLRCLYQFFVCMFEKRGYFYVTQTHVYFKVVIWQLVWSTKRRLEKNMKQRGIQRPIISSSSATSFSQRRTPRRSCVSKIGEISPTFLILPAALMHGFESYLSGLYISCLLWDIFTLSYLLLGTTYLDQHLFPHR